MLTVDSYLKVLAAIYATNPRPGNDFIRGFMVEQFLSDKSIDLMSVVKYLHDKHYVEADFLGHHDVKMKLTGKAIELIEDPLNSIRKSEQSIINQDNSLTIQNINSQNASINIINSSIIQKNMTLPSDEDSSYIKDSLEEILSSLKQLNLNNIEIEKSISEILTQLKNNDRIGAAKKINDIWRSALKKIIVNATSKSAKLFLVNSFPMIFNLIKRIFSLP